MQKKSHTSVFIADRRQGVGIEGNMEKRIVSLIFTASVMGSQDTDSSFLNEKLRYSIRFSYKDNHNKTLKNNDMTTQNWEELEGRRK